MALVIKERAAVFDLTQIGPGNLLWGRHRTWREGKAGFVTSATKEQLIVQYHPGIGNVTNHFIIPASEAEAGQWEIRWSADMTEVFVHDVRKDDDQKEEGDSDEAGGTDI